MCLLFHCRDVHPDYPFILLANRDEFYDRPTRAAGFWPENPDVLAGRDLRRHGTWLGMTRSGRWAALTNYREPPAGAFERSRGEIVRDYLTGDQPPGDFAAALQRRAADYDGFNLLFGDQGESLWLSNRGGSMRALGPGIHGLSNHLLETPWPKVEAGKRALHDQLEDGLVTDRLFGPLADRAVYDEQDLPDTGLDPETETMLSAAFITSSRYGTRSTTLVMLNRSGGAYFEERTYDGRRGGGDPDDYCSRIFEFRLARA